MMDEKIEKLPENKALIVITIDIGMKKFDMMVEGKINPLDTLKILMGCQNRVIATIKETDVEAKQKSNLIIPKVKVN
jgi:hypothetical protein